MQDSKKNIVSRGDNMKFTIEIGAMVMPYCRDMVKLKNYIEDSGYEFYRYIGDDTILFKGLNEELVVTQQGNYFIDVDIEISKEFIDCGSYINREIHKYVSSLRGFILGLDKLLHSKMIKDDIRIYWNGRNKVCGENYPFNTTINLTEG